MKARRGGRGKKRGRSSAPTPSIAYVVRQTTIRVPPGRNSVRLTVSEVRVLVYRLVSVSKNSRLSRVRLKRSMMGRMASLPPPMASIMRRRV